MLSIAGLRWTAKTEILHLASRLMFTCSFHDMANFMDEHQGNFIHNEWFIMTKNKELISHLQLENVLFYISFLSKVGKKAQQHIHGQATCTWGPDVSHQRHKPCEPVLLLSEKMWITTDLLFTSTFALAWKATDLDSSCSCRCEALSRTFQVHSGATLFALAAGWRVMCFLSPAMAAVRT